MPRLTRLPLVSSSAGSLLSGFRIPRLRFDLLPPSSPRHRPHQTSIFTKDFVSSPAKPKVMSAVETPNPPESAVPAPIDHTEPDESPGRDFVHGAEADRHPVETREYGPVENPELYASEDAAGGDCASSSAAFPSGGQSDGSEAKRVLPEELSRSVVLLQCESSAEGGVCDVYVVGTAHVSKESCREVQAVISYLKPQVVFLELCSSRVSTLTPQNLEVPTVNDMIHMWKRRNMNAMGILYSWFLAKVADQLEVLPGAEFRVAFEEATSYGAKVILGDRPVQITLRRTWGRMSLRQKTKFLYYLLFQAMFLPSPDELNKILKDMDDVDVLTLLIQEMSKAFPTLIETLLHERDMYMSSKLLKIAREHSSVVAVVGKGHLVGIKKHWKQPVEVKDLMEIPARTSGSPFKIITSVGLVITGVAIISKIYLAGKK